MLSPGASCAFLLLTVLIYIKLAPWTKVEESFNMQACHDLMFHQTDLTQYDHKEFPGVVPRTFIGAISLSAIGLPATKLSTEMFQTTHVVGLYIVRIILGTLGVLSFKMLGNSIETVFGSRACSIFFVLVDSWRPSKSCSFYDGVYRGEFCPPALDMLTRRTLSLRSLFIFGCLSGCASLAVTTTIDSIFWGRLVWPEAQVFYFNTFLNKSKEWGVMPFMWYFTSALPRTLSTAYPLAFLASTEERRIRPILSVAVVYVVLYSNLGHKEARFLFPILPLFNLCAAVGIARLINNRQKSPWRFMAAALAVGSLCLMAFLSMGMTWVSIHNYPGGDALQKLYASESFSKWYNEGLSIDSQQHMKVHIGVLPAMTGVSRFGELQGPWTYSKEEGLALEIYRERFTHLLSEHKEVIGFTQIGAAQGFAGLSLPTNLESAISFFSGRRSIIKLSDQVYIHKRILEGAPR